MKQRLINCRLFDGDALRDAHDVLLDGAQIAAIIAADEAVPCDEVVDLGGHLLAPGLIDLQVNGGGGVLFNAEPTIAALRTIADAHRRFGTTSFLPTLITDDDDVMETAIATVAQAMDEKLAGVIGIHLEGPHLNPQRRGVHDAGRMRPLDEKAFARLCAFAAGPTLLTVAPETLPAGALARLTEAGVIVCGGHSEASYEQTCAALDEGLAGFTHLSNAMSGMQSRAPGMVGAALADKDSFAGIIADGFHVHPAVFAVAVAAKARGKLVLVSDAMPTVGSDIGQFMLFGEEVLAGDGRCVTADGTLAGADIGLIDAVRNAAQFADIDLYEALRMASCYPAAALGVADQLGFIRPGYRANLVELDAGLQVCRTWVDGGRREHAGNGAIDV
tara:strand:- start:1728 stop:2894 length:1167 start_codon:yes stop_codon:yes gene_type:complete